MLDEFVMHNLHWENKEEFYQKDPQLRRLQQLKYAHVPKVLEALPKKDAGIYTIGGGRQIGKSTLLKQWMKVLLQGGIPPKTIYYLSGELILDSRRLLNLLQEIFENITKNGENLLNDSLLYIIVDEVTYIKDWDKGVKFAADAGWLDRVVLVLTGSDLVLMQEARMRFPGRRGRSETVDFHIYPLSFKETVFLIEESETILSEIEKQVSTPSTETLDALFTHFEHYTTHGGYLRAINDFYMEGTISKSSYITYSDWIRGDILNRGKQEHFLQEILGAVLKRYGSQITWNTLTQDLSIDHPKTISEYIQILERMDVLFILPALMEHQLLPAPKKPKKVFFMDPFICHAVAKWLSVGTAKIMDPFLPLLIEGIVASHYHRYYPSYYIKSKNEIDIAYIKDDQAWPIEIKWTNQIRPEDIRSIKQYPKGLLLTKLKKIGQIDQLKMLPLPWHLVTAL